MEGSGVKYWKNYPETDKDIGIILVGKVSIHDVDWFTTIAVNSFHEDETEIVIEEGSPVLIEMIVEADKLGVHYNNGILSRPNQIFHA